jgi:phosphinothricin acetyltransferase
MIVRDARPEDGAALAAIYAPYVLETAISFEEVPPSGEQMAKRIADLSATHPFLVAEDGRVLGFAYACAHRLRGAYRWATDVSVYVAGDAHRRGVGRALYAKLLPLLREQGFVTAHAGICLPNEKSERFHESFGFVRIATYPAVGYKLGKWHDTGWWQLRLVDTLPDPPPQLRAR